MSWTGMHALPIHHANPYNNYNFQNDGKFMVLYFGLWLKIGAVTKLGLFFPVVCIINVFDQTLAG